MVKEYPSPIYSNVPGTWAYSTVRERLPDIAGRVIKENQYSNEINQGLSQLREEINTQTIRPLSGLGAPDQSTWEGYVQPYLGQSWLDVPWFFAEHYFYRRIIEAVDYFNLGQDPFGHQKRQGLEKNIADILSLARFLQRRSREERGVEKILEEGLYFSLWGNQADLSLWPAGSEENPKHISPKSLQDHLLVNDIQQVLKVLVGGSTSRARLDILLDNAGFELISDLGLVDILLGHNLVERVVLHAKSHPTFVSDVIPVDVEEAIQFLAVLGDQDARSFASRLENYSTAGQLQIESHPFWNSPLPLWELPDDLGREWRGSSLVISKGDMNYRRILGDLQWEYSLPFQQVVDYLPAPLAALRTLKAELAVGLGQDQVQTVENRDPNWMVDGCWGVIHFSG